jgi:hypothetical protein
MNEITPMQKALDEARALANALALKLQELDGLLQKMKR